MFGIPGAGNVSNIGGGAEYGNPPPWHDSPPFITGV